ncbi:MAG: MMPL family transporter [Actinomycetota bacterium]|nr:MMPL family transporter [Actinomycetota bacterium]
MSWERLADIVLHRPGRVLLASLLLLLLPALAVPATRTSYDVVSELPESAESVQGLNRISRSFTAGQAQPLVLVIDDDRSIWNNRSFEAIDDLTVNLRKLPHVTTVRSLTSPTDRPISAQQLPPELRNLASFPKRLEQGANGLGRAIDGLEQIRGGLIRIQTQLPSAPPAGTDQLQQALQGIALMRSGVGRIREGLAFGSSAMERLAGEVAAPTLANLERAWEDLRRSTVAKADPVYPDLAEAVGTALALVSGRCPDPSGVAPPVMAPEGRPCRPGEQLRAGYDGLVPSLLRTAEGMEQGAAGLVLIDNGLARLDQGLRQAAGGAVGDLAAGLEELRNATDRMIGGLNQIIPGLDRLRRGLHAGVDMTERLGLATPPPGGFALTASLVEAFPQIKKQLSLLVSDRGTATRLFITLDRPGYETESLQTSREIKDVARLSLSRTALDDANVYLSGTSALLADVDDVSQRDFIKIVMAVIVAIFLIFVLLLRSLAAPVYLVLTVLLSFLCTLGLTVLVFQGLLGEEGIVFWVIPLLFVMLVALGADYNIFLMSRIREEAEEKETRTAVARGLSLTGGVITSAGLILAGTFAALIAAPLTGLVQAGFATTIGILLDTFVVRSLLVPSIAVLVGRANWWPSARAQRP